MRKAFTLIEVMISIILLAIIITFLYETIAQLQSSNTQLLDKTFKRESRENILKVLYNDLINAKKISTKTSLDAKDTITIQTSNSLYDMANPYVYYLLSKDVLLRVESPQEELSTTQDLFRFDKICTGVSMLKMYENKGHYLVYLQAENMEKIYLDIVPPALTEVSENENNSTVNTDKEDT